MLHTTYLGIYAILRSRWHIAILESTPSPTFREAAVWPLDFRRLNNSGGVTKWTNHLQSLQLCTTINFTSSQFPTTRLPLPHTYIHDCTDSCCCRHSLSMGYPRKGREIPIAVAISRLSNYLDCIEGNLL